MMDYKVICFIIIITLVGCNRTSNIDIEGNWYFISKDSIYFEMYVFEDSTLRFQPFSEPASGIHSYHIVKSSLEYFDYCYKIVFIDTNSLLLYNNVDSLFIRRLLSPYDYDEPEFHQGFKLRACYFMVLNEYWKPKIAYDTITFFNQNKLQPDFLTK